MLHDHVGHRTIFPLEVFFKDFLFCKWLTIGSVFKLLVLHRQISEVNSGQTIYPKNVSCDTEEGRSHIMIFVCLYSAPLSIMSGKACVQLYQSQIPLGLA
jgi:hypothetical protein